LYAVNAQPFFGGGPRGGRSKAVPPHSEYRETAAGTQRLRGSSPTLEKGRASLGLGWV
jgi:hypothetical protein